MIDWIEGVRKKEIQNMRLGFLFVFWVDGGTIPLVTCMEENQCMPSQKDQE